MKKWIYKLLIKWGVLKRDTTIWILVYIIGDSQKPILEYFFSELEAVNRQRELFENNQDFASVLNSYTGVDTKRPIEFVKTYPKTQPSRKRG